MPAPAQRIVLTGGAGVAVLGSALPVGERDAAGDAVGAVPGDLDHWLTRAVPVGLAAGFLAVDTVAECPARAIAYRADDLIHPPAAGGDERFLALAEDGRQPAGAISRVLAGAPVVEDGHLLPGVGVAPVRDPAGVFGAGEPDGCVAAIAQWLDFRAAAAAQRQLRPHAHRLAQPVDQGMGAGDQVRAISHDPDTRIQSGLQRAQLREAAFGRARAGRSDSQVLQRRGGLGKLRQARRPGPQRGRGAGQFPQLVTTAGRGRMS